LHRDHGVKVINFADENPTVSKKAWRKFLEALIAENVDLILVGSTRADDIVRDADILHLYKKAGWVRFLLGVESTRERFNGSARAQRPRPTGKPSARCGNTASCRWRPGWWVLRRRRIAITGAACGSSCPTTPTRFSCLRHAHRWTPYFRLGAGRRVIQVDRRRWDY
jgi:anaerobic magnesium-protoporphyrin IX monomethyl ester cyclase